jgi:hypothetical protein
MGIVYIEFAEFLILFCETKEERAKIQDHKFSNMSAPQVTIYFVSIESKNSIWLFIMISFNHISLVGGQNCMIIVIVNNDLFWLEFHLTITKFYTTNEWQSEHDGNNNKP